MKVVLILNPDLFPLYNIYPYWDRQAWANSVDPDQMLQNAASDLDLHYLQFIQQILDIIGSKMNWPSKLDFQLFSGLCVHCS